MDRLPDDWAQIAEGVAVRHDGQVTIEVRGGSEGAIFARAHLIEDALTPPRRMPGFYTVPCGACGGTGKASTFLAVRRDRQACDGCKGAGVHALPSPRDPGIREPQL